MPRLLVTFFLALLVGVPLVQAVREAAAGEPVHLGRVWRRDAEDELRESSLLAQGIVPPYQRTLRSLFGYVGSKVFSGRDGWLFLAEDIDTVTAPGFLQPGLGGARALEVIAAFDAELDAHGIALWVLPMPTKAMVDPAFVSDRTRRLERALNPDQERFLRELQKRGIRTLDAFDVLGQAAPPHYLREDTHWSPATMRAFAAHTAAELLRLDPGLRGGVELATRAVSVTGRGDLVRMLEEEEPRRTFEIEEILLDGSPLRPDRASPVLLLGDSFTRVFSDPALELGSSAGFAERLSLELGAPIDVIALSGGGASAVRQALARRGAGALAGKRAVVWQFTMRELVAGDEAWSEVEIDWSDARVATPESADSPLEVVAQLVELSHVSEDFDYEFSLSIFEYRVREVLTGEWGDEPLWVAHVAFRDFEPTEAQSFEVGEVHRLRLERLEQHYSLEETPWIDETDAGLRILWPAEWSRQP